VLIAPVARVATGRTPVALAEDRDNHTLYVANVAAKTLSVIDTERCNAQRTRGCRALARTVRVGTGPGGLAVDRQNQTIYVANTGDNTVSVIDARRCNAQHTAGCRQRPPVQAVGGAPGPIAVSKSGDTVYVANTGLGVTNNRVRGGNTVSVIDGTECNGAHRRGCTAVPPPVVAVGGFPGGQPQALAVDEQTHNVYVANNNDDTLSVIGGTRCNARQVFGCARPAPSVQTGAAPSAVAVIPSMHTIYVADSADNAVAVIDDRACTDPHRVGCRPAPVPAAPLARYHRLGGTAVDAAQHTAYVIDYGLRNGPRDILRLIDTSRCNGGHTSGCKPHPAVRTITLRGVAGYVAVDPSTDTLYVSEGNPGPAGLEVIAAASCNATLSSCSKRAFVAPANANAKAHAFGGGPVAVDAVTHTVYVGGTSDTAVLDARHCNAADMTGCATQTPATIPVAFPASLGVGPDTLYAAIQPKGDPTIPGFVDVIDTRHCQALDTSQRATQHPPQVTVGAGPYDTAVDLAHHTLYVPDNANGDSAGLLSMIDTTRCNGDDTSGCTSQRPPATPMRRAPTSATLDPFTDTLYVTNFGDASVSLINHRQLQRHNARRLPASPGADDRREWPRRINIRSRYTHPLRPQLQ